MKSSKVLLKAMDIIATPDKWAKDAYARNSDGDAVVVDSKEAVCFCSLGALKKVGENVYDSKAVHYLSNTMAAHRSIPSFNDHHATTHDKVMEKFMTAYFLAASDND